MKITRLGHACLLFESADARVLVDPGNFSDDWHDLTDLAAVLVTHQHRDHFDPKPVRDIMTGNPGARLLVEEQVVPIAAEAGLEPDVAAPGDSLAFGSLRVAVEGGRHAVIHPSIPRVGNVGFVVSEGDGPRVYHPGDSYEYPLEGVDVLALPLNAPWGRVEQAADFVTAVAPERVFPIHDGLLGSNGLAVYMRLVRQITEMDVEDVRPGTSLDA